MNFPILSKSFDSFLFQMLHISEKKQTGRFGDQSADYAELNYCLSEYLLGEEGEIYSPVAPGVTAFRFVILYRVALGLAIVIEKHRVLLHAVILAAGDPVKKRSLALGHLCGESGFLFRSIGRDCSGEHTHICECARVRPRNCAGLAGAHRKAGDGAVLIALGHAVIALYE